MRETIASKTAERVAWRRAAHQLYDQPKIFNDPLALRIIGLEAERSLLANSDEVQRPTARRMRAFFVARSRYAEDELAESIQRGVRQCVILGAGLDTFAYRNPYPELNLFEVDHPVTQAWKRERLAVAGIGIPAELCFVPVDFEIQSLATELKLANFDLSRPAFFSWLGVTPYLTRPAFDATVGFIAALPKHSGVVFDSVIDRAFLNARQQEALSRLASRVESAGEPFRLFFEPAQIIQDLGHLGLHHVKILGPNEINQRYFANRTDGLCVNGALGHLISARR